MIEHLDMFEIHFTLTPTGVVSRPSRLAFSSSSNIFECPKLTPSCEVSISEFRIRQFPKLAPILPFLVQALIVLSTFAHDIERGVKLPKKRKKMSVTHSIATGCCFHDYFFVRCPVIDPKNPELGVHPQPWQEGNKCDHVGCCTGYGGAF